MTTAIYDLTSVEFQITRENRDHHIPVIDRLKQYCPTFKLMRTNRNNLHIVQFDPLHLIPNSFHNLIPNYDGLANKI